MIHEQKSGMMRDLWRLLRVPCRYLPPTPEARLQEEQMGDEIRATVPEAFYDPKVGVNRHIKCVEQQYYVHSTTM
jgi:hypothetical protein